MVAFLAVPASLTGLAGSTGTALTTAAGTSLAVAAGTGLVGAAGTAAAASLPPMLKKYGWDIAMLAASAAFADRRIPLTAAGGKLTALAKDLPDWRRS